MGALASFASQPAARRRLALRALFWIVAARIGVALVGFARLRRLLPPLRGSVAQTRAADVRWAVTAVARRVPGTRCLARSLAIEALLRGAGIESELRFGVVRQDGGRLEAHAWVECDGRPVCPDEDLSPYTPLSPLPDRP